MHKKDYLKPDDSACPDRKLLHRQEIINRNGHESQFISKPYQAEETNGMKSYGVDVLLVLLEHYKTLRLIIPDPDAPIIIPGGHKNGLPGAHGEAVDGSMMQGLTHDPQVLWNDVNRKVGGPELRGEELGPTSRDNDVIRTWVRGDGVDGVEAFRGFWVLRDLSGYLEDVLVDELVGSVLLIDENFTWAEAEGEALRERYQRSDLLVSVLHRWLEDEVLAELQIHHGDLLDLEDALQFAVL